MAIACKGKILSVDNYPYIKYNYFDKLNLFFLNMVLCVLVLLSEMRQRFCVHLQGHIRNI